MRPTVYLADLRYNYSGVLANDCMPLGVAYMKAVMDRDLPEARSRLFVYPDRLEEAIRRDPPDVLMLTNYCWNERLSLQMAALAKARRPDILTVLGGPNVPLESDRQRAYLAAHPELDVYVLGEGDFLATELVRRFIDAALSPRRFAESDMPSSLYRRPDGSLQLSPAWPRHREVDEIPSPWLSGIQDEFFDGKLAPIIETNRGCPFQCTFCVQGTGWYTKVHYFDKDRLKAEIEYISRRIAAVCPSQGTLRIADSNYGMFERDIELSGHLGEMMKAYGYPKYIDATTGKNRPDRIIQSVEKASGALLVYQAVQSLDETVLRNIKRQNIQLKAYEQLHVLMRGRGLRSNSDLILGLPGETLETHLNGCRKLLDAGTNQVTNFQLMMLKGSELETLESRRMFSFVSRFRVLPKNFGVYGGHKVFDIEEIVVSTDTLSFDDYLQARKYALASAAFWHDNLFEDVFQFAQRLGLKRSQFWDALVPAMEHDTGAVREYLDNFVRETVNELFPTPEACIEFYSQDEHFARLQAGEIGDNLMHKYRAIASFHLWPPICRTGMNTMRRLIVEHGLDTAIADFDVFWRDFHQFVECKHAHGFTTRDILADKRAAFQYDIPRWIADGMPMGTAPYRLLEPEEFQFFLSSESRQGLGAALEVWTPGLKGLAKMVTRIKVEWQVHECNRLERESAVTPLLTATMLLLLVAGSVGLTAEQRVSATPMPAAIAPAAVVPPPYRLSPGDVVDVKFAYNPELNDTVAVRPDGCISLQVIGDVRALRLTPMELAAHVNEAYAKHLRRPEVSVIVRELAAQKAYVGGEVMTPGVVDLRNGMTSLQAILQMGGVRPSAKLENVVLMSYGGAERAEVRKLNLKRMLDGRDPDPVLAAYDVIFVPRSGIAKIGLFVQQYVDSLVPRSLMFPYNLNTAVTVK